MKKIILSLLVISMVIVLGVGLTACNNATPQGQLTNLLSTHNHEVFKYDILTYDVQNETYAPERGVYTARLDAFKSGESVPFGSRTLENVGAGVRVTGELIYGDTVYDMGCYYTLVSGTSYMVPAYSYMNITENSVKTFEMQGSYSGSTFECERIIGGEKFNDSVKLSGTVFDNHQFQQILRALPSSTFSGGMNLSFSTPIARADEFTDVSLTASGNSTSMIKTPYTDASQNEEISTNGINCYKISLSRTTEIKKTMTHTLYYAVDEIKYNGWGMKNVLVKIVEPYTDSNRNTFETHYNLVSVELS